ncbi:MAG: molybdopterin molybdenumtransferase MoeA, partial [Phenylobacterium sp.]|nr:molybdopterin molybdenumtransferase MoeA [Phenylobacterium sp.]
MKLMTVEAARAAMLAEIPRLACEDVTLDESIGRVLAQDVAAIRDQPPFDASAMDGWAVRSGDGDGERTIIGESAAGHGFEGELGGGQAVRIFTGAALPAGADAVVIQEDAERRGDRVAVPAAMPRQNVRP